jgi:TonB-linked SusC/RagA family outer membrane protein
MKLTTVLLIVSMMQVSAASFAQNVTLKQKNVSLEQLFKAIRKQTGYAVVWSGIKIRETKNINADFNNTPLDQVLNTTLKSQRLNYEFENKNIIITRGEENVIENLVARFQEIDVRGRVVDSEGNGLPGASVLVKKGKGSTKTDAKGEFYLKNVPDNAVLVISYIGYKSREVKANRNLGDVYLSLFESKLDEIQIIAYGQVDKKYSTSNIGSIKADAIIKQPVSNLLLTMQGRVPGLFINQTTGVSGGDVDVTIQGKNSMAQGNEPFYVIDGIPFVSKTLLGLSGTTIPSTFSSTFNFINPNDIESIEILKDADATAIYGSRASNGAVLITTKKGKAGDSKIDINTQTGWGRITRKQSLMNSSQYLDLRREAIKNAGLTPTDADYDLTFYDQNKNTNWQDVLVGGTAKFTNLQASVSGGTANTQFLAGGGYVHETTVYPGDLADTKSSVHFNINHRSTNQKFRFNLSGSYLQDNNTLAGADLMSSATILAPNAPDLYKSDGTINWGQSTTDPNTYYFTDNPISYLFRKYNAKTYNVISNALIGYEIIPGLELKSTFGYNRLTRDENNTIPLTSIRPDFLSFLGREANFSSNYIASYIAEPQITYTKEILNSHFDILLGGTFQQTESDVKSVHATGYTTDAQLLNMSAASTLSDAYALHSLYRYNALFGRINYRYRNKYILNLTARRDGSSRFGSANLLTNFYSVGGAWLFGDESFVKSSLPFFSSGKLRATFGTTGNDQIGDYTFLNLYNNYTGGITNPYQQTVGLLPTGFSNINLQWEKTKKLNIGLDLGFLANRITASTNYFLSRSSNQLIQDGVPIYTGFASFKRNLPAIVQNSGWELQLEALPLKSNSFNWQTSINLTIPRNKIVSYPNLNTSNNVNKYVIGQPANIIKTYQLIGVNQETGLYEYLTVDGKAVTSPNTLTDKTALVNLNPKFYGGFNNSLSYKSLSLDFLFMFVKQMALNNRFGSFPGNVISNQPVNIVDRWHTPGDLSKVQVATDFNLIYDSQNAATESNAAYSDASFIRLKNVSLSYSLPNLWMQKAKISKARFYVQGQNLLTISDYLWSDPETHSPGSLPPLKMYTVGLQLTF